LNKLQNDNYNLSVAAMLISTGLIISKKKKINSITANAMTPWVEASVQFMTLDDHLFLRTQMKISKL
jgi:hypothetical protein